MIGLVPVQEPDFIEAPGIAELGQAIHGAVEDEGGVDGLAPAHVGDGGIVVVKGAPALHRQGVAAGVHGSAAGYRGQAFNVAVVEGDRLFGEAVEVGRLDPVVAVAGQVVVLQAVEHKHDNIFLSQIWHVASLSFGWPLRYSNLVPESRWRKKAIDYKAIPMISQSLAIDRVEI